MGCPSRLIGGHGFIFPSIRGGIPIRLIAGCAVTFGKVSVAVG